MTDEMIDASEIQLVEEIVAKLNSRRSAGLSTTREELVDAVMADHSDIGGPDAEVYKMLARYAVTTAVGHIFDHIESQQREAP